MVGATFRTTTCTENDVQQLQAYGEDMALKVEFEKLRFEEMCMEAKRLRQDIVARQKERAQLGGADASRITVFKINKRIRLLEEKLHRILMKTGDVDTACADLRDTINRCRQHQMLKKQIYDQLQTSLETTRAELDELMHQSSKLVEERDQAFADLTDLRAISEREEKQYRKDFIAVSKTVVMEKQRAEILRVQAHKVDDSGELRSLIQHRQTRDREFEATQRQMAEQRAQEERMQQMQEEMVNKYLQAFASLQAYTGIDSVADMVARFIAQEDENFALFSYVQHINRDIKSIEHQHMQVLENMHKFAMEQGSSDSQRKRTMREMESKFHKLRKQQDVLDKQQDEHLTAIRNVATVVDSLYHRLEAGIPKPRVATAKSDDRRSTSGRRPPSRAPSPEQTETATPISSLSQQPVTAANITEFMAAIEQRVAELVIQQRQALGMGAEATELPGIVLATPTRSSPLPGRTSSEVSEMLAIRGLDDDSDDDDSGTPWSHDKVHQAARRALDGSPTWNSLNSSGTKQPPNTTSRMPRLTKSRQRQSGGSRDGRKPRRASGSNAMPPVSSIW